MILSHGVYVQARGYVSPLHAAKWRMREVNCNLARANLAQANTYA